MNNSDCMLFEKKNLIASLLRWECKHAIISSWEDKQSKNHKAGSKSAAKKQKLLPRLMSGVTFQLNIKRDVGGGGGLNDHSVTNVKRANQKC